MSKRKSRVQYQQILSLENYPVAQEMFKAALSGKYSMIIFGGAIRGGKSFNLLGALVMLLRMNPGARAAIVRKDLPTLKTNTLPTCKKVFPEPYMKLVDATRYRWTCRPVQNRQSEAFFFAEQYKQDKELARWDGLEVNYFMLDQMEELHEGTLTKAFERAGAYIIPGVAKEDQPRPLILASVNPTYNYVRRMIYEPWLNGELPEDWLYIPAKIFDNPHVPETYLKSLEQLRRLDPEEYKRRVEGDWNYLNSKKALYAYDAVADIFSNSWITGDGKMAMTADIAFDGSDKFVLMVWDGWKVVHIHQEPMIDDSKYMVKIMRNTAKRFKVPASRIVYDSDGVGRFLKGFFKYSRPFVNAASPMQDPAYRPKKGEKEILPQYEHLKAQCYYYLRRLLNERKIYVEGATGEEESWIIEELMAIQRGNHPSKLSINKKDDQREILGRSPDFGDNFAMRASLDLKPVRRSKSRTLSA